MLVVIVTHLQCPQQMDGQSGDHGPPEKVAHPVELLSRRALGIHSKCPVSPGAVPCGKQTPVPLPSGPSVRTPAIFPQDLEEVLKSELSGNFEGSLGPSGCAPMSMLPGSCRERAMKGLARVRAVLIEGPVHRTNKVSPSEPLRSVHMPVREGYSSKKGKSSWPSHPVVSKFGQAICPLGSHWRRLFQYSDGRFWCYCPWLDRIEPSRRAVSIQLYFSKRCSFICGIRVLLYLPSMTLQVS